MEQIDEEGIELRLYGDGRERPVVTTLQTRMVKICVGVHYAAPILNLLRMRVPRVLQRLS